MHEMEFKFETKGELGHAFTIELTTIINITFVFSIYIYLYKEHKVKQTNTIQFNELCKGPDFIVAYKSYLIRY